MKGPVFRSDGDHLLKSCRVACSCCWLQLTVMLRMAFVAVTFLPSQVDKPAQQLLSHGSQAKDVFHVFKWLEGGINEE